MLMTYENLERLLNIWDKPDLSALTRLLVARRMARQYQLGWEADRTSADRKIKEARKGLPFTRARLEQAKEFRKTSSGYHEKAQATLGAWLLQAERWIEREIGVDRICDALGVNPVHRAAIQGGKPGQMLNHIAFVEGLEDSSSAFSGRREADLKDGPLFNCIIAEMLRFVEENPEALPDPFAPGGPLYGVPQTVIRNDGTIETRRAALTLHCRDGSMRVIERKPEVGRE
ncbi:TPA: hypothetical protein ACTL7P_003307 [Pseudomonas aeruginosa]|uniref:Uncharacterized protein n=1 Tax=Pseudomonas paraeruginosa TaxID=2994495 RepID=A0A2R3ITA4_9PSED|nr:MULTISPECIES: hypothetical protein [Pseudomonas aeruginosa group]AVK05142.1 hypothetical protein CSB93_3200 [Pseudomonas paraeruginosa]AWE93798.1 hypothetical protein CSC28_1975 [Pseudomonas paraeruginosa]EKX9246878.1 hypothetical protein [Pseudomonas aeruginosa]KHE58985.1 hypothetical protein D480_0220785 [Pseudomonas aeruginosa]MCF1243672.1 hypothetical protein [Pseudomonas aeruginosa]